MGVPGWNVIISNSNRIVVFNFFSIGFLMINYRFKIEENNDDKIISTFSDNLAESLKIIEVGDGRLDFMIFTNDKGWRIEIGNGNDINVIEADSITELLVELAFEYNNVSMFFLNCPQHMKKNKEREFKLIAAAMYALDLYAKEYLDIARLK